MASLSCNLLLSLILFSSLQFYTASSTEFEVGGDNGWTVPSKHHDDIYNSWASKNRLKVNDTVRFKYKIDSVMVVSEEEYQKCQSSHPIFFSNNGDTVFKLDRPGFFYFISGVSSHCERGQKMIVKVLEPAAPPQSQNSTAHSQPKKNGTAELAAFSWTSIFMFVSVVLGMHLVTHSFPLF
ncbi:hypothetical protein SLE2022_364860 [Rubroshorea leprosula]